MAVYATLDELKAALSGVVTVAGDGLTVDDAAAFRTTLCDPLTETAVFAEDTAVRNAARWVIRAFTPRWCVLCKAARRFATNRIGRRSSIA